MASMAGLIPTLPRSMTLATGTRFPARVAFPLRSLSGSQHLCRISGRDIANMVEEQLLLRGHGKRFYPVKPAQILHDRYRIVAKLGCGTSATVWLAHDQRLAVTSFYDSI